MDDKLRT